MSGMPHKVKCSATHCEPGTLFPHGPQELEREGHRWSHSLCPFLWHWAVGIWDADPWSPLCSSCTACVGRLSPGPATSQWHQRLSCDACHGAHHRMRVSVDLFGLIRAQQSHGSWQTLQDRAVAMVLAHESCKRRVVCFPCGNCSRQGLFPEVCQVSEPSARSLLQVNVLIFLFSSLLPSPLFPGVWS